MVINEETKELDITLPHAKPIQDPSLPMIKYKPLTMAGFSVLILKLMRGLRRPLRHKSKFVKRPSLLVY
jgi:hypothetical protein